MKHFRDRWGYLLFAVLITAWWTKAAGPGALAVLSAVVVAFMLFRAPLTCGAPNRKAGTFCRNGSKGLLPGCTRVSGHRWGKLRGDFLAATWGAVVRPGLGCIARAEKGLNLLALMVAIVSGIVGTVLQLADR